MSRDEFIDGIINFGMLVTGICLVCIGVNSSLAGVGVLGVAVMALTAIDMLRKIR